MMIYLKPTKQDLYILLTSNNLLHSIELTRKLRSKYKEMRNTRSSLLSRPFYQTKDSEDNFVDPACDVTINSGDEQIRTNSRDMLDIIGEAQSGEKIVIHASAGMGKTYTMTHCVTRWQEGDDRLQSYKHVFFLPVRKICNRSEVIERVICHDLDIVPQSYATSVRLALRNLPSSKSLILLDGYDELRDNEKQISIVAKILSSKIAKRAVVVVTTRPEDIPHIKHLINNQYVDVTLKKLSEQAVYRYIEQAFPNDYDSFQLVCRDLTRDYHIFFPKEFVTTPLFLALICHICRISIRNNKTLDMLYEIKTVEALIGSLWGHMIRVKTGKEDIDHADFVSSLFDKGTPEDIRWMFHCVARMSFHCLQKGEYKFTDEIMRNNLENKYIKASYLSKLGPVDIIDGGMVFIHKLFQEYCAAHYMTEDNAVFMEMLSLCHLRHENMHMFETFRTSIVLAVGRN